MSIRNSLVHNTLILILWIIIYTNTTTKLALNIIGIISLILDDIYDDDIKEYDKKHPEFVFLRLFDNLSNGNVELISKDNELYDLIDDGFIRLELSNLKSMTN